MAIDAYEDRTLPTGESIDLAGEVSTFFTVAGSRDVESGFEFSKVAFDRIMTAASPSIVDMVRAVSGRRPNAFEHSPWKIRKVKLADRWSIGLSLEDEQGCGYAFIAKLKPPQTAADLVRSSVSMEPMMLRFRLQRQGLSPEEVERRIAAEPAIDEQALLRRFIDQGFPEHLPDPDTVSAVGEVLVIRHEGDLAKALADVKKTYRHDRVLGRFNPPRQDRDDGNWAMGAGTECNDPTGWVGALSALGQASLATGHFADIAERAREVGRRNYVTFSWDDQAHLSKERLGQAFALLDGGMPGQEAKEFVAGFGAAMAARVMTDRLSDTIDVRDGLLAGGHANAKNAFEFNDLDNHLHLTKVGDHDVIWVRDQHGKLMIVLKDGPDGIERMGLARIDMPGSPKPAEIARLLANPDATANELSFKGFRGTYRATADRLGLVPDVPMEVTKRAIWDVNLLSIVMDGGSISLEEERKEQARPSR